MEEIKRRRRGLWYARPTDRPTGGGGSTQSMIECLWEAVMEEKEEIRIPRATNASYIERAAHEDSYVVLR